MNLRYVGAVKDLLYLPLWAAAGPSIELFRVLSMAMGALGILGTGALLAQFVGWRAAAAGSLTLAIHPAYIQQTVFDSGLIASWMMAAGLLGIAISAYAARPCARTAFLLGAACGFAVWARANFVWLLAAAAVSVAAVAWRELWAHRLHAQFFAFGGIVGAFPFLLYQWISRGGTVEALSMYPAEGSLASQLPARLLLLAETMLSDREHRAMWGGAEMPIWQAAVIGTLAAIALAACWRAGGGFGRLIVLTTLLLTAILLTSRMAIGEHHLVAVVPLLAIAVGIAGSGKRLAIPMLGLYAALAMWWNVTAILGLHHTGGSGHWSDASGRLSETLASNGGEVVFIDWGLHNPVYFLTRGGLRARELYGGELRAETGEPWNVLVEPGRVFVTNGQGHRVFSGPTEGVRSALKERPGARRIAVPQRSGAVYAEILRPADR
jgi:hypothetical protein